MGPRCHGDDDVDFHSPGLAGGLRILLRFGRLAESSTARPSAAIQDSRFKIQDMRYSEAENLCKSQTFSGLVIQRRKRGSQFFLGVLCERFSVYSVLKVFGCPTAALSNTRACGDATASPPLSLFTSLLGLPNRRFSIAARQRSVSAHGFFNHPSPIANRQ